MPISVPTATLARLHRYSGAVLGVFVAVHLVNHLLLLRSPAAHIAMMASLRLAYRWPPAEALLLVCVLIQAVTGFMRLRKRAAGAPPPGLAVRAVRLAGLYLLYFLPIHTLAVLGARGALKLDTNLYFAAAGLHLWPFSLYFAPYYVLAVAAVCLHLGGAMAPRLGVRSLPARRGALLLAGTAGIAMGVAIVAAMANGQLRIPAQYLAVFQAVMP
jgi:signal transduction histidine kinase